LAAYGFKKAILLHTNLPACFEMDTHYLPVMTVMTNTIEIVVVNKNYVKTNDRKQGGKSMKK
jgi:hypothetical protein